MLLLNMIMKTKTKTNHNKTISKTRVYNNSGFSYII